MKTSLPYRSHVSLRLFLVLLLGFVSTGRSESLAEDSSSLQKTLEQLSGDAAKAYVAPIVSGFGAGLNAGWFHKSPPPKLFSINVEASAIIMGTFLDGGQKHFSKQGSFQLSKAEATEFAGFVDSDPNYASLSAGQRQQLKDTLIGRITAQKVTVRMSGATVIGEKKDSVRIHLAEKKFTVPVPGPSGTENKEVTIPGDSVALPVGGLFSKVPLLPLLAPQITVGTVAGTQLTFRYLPAINLTDEIGSLTLFGFGIQHNPSVWLPKPLPVDLSFGLFRQTLEVGDLFKASALAFGLNASKTFGWRLFNVAPYAGFMLEKSTMEFKYKFETQLPNGTVTKENVKFEVDGENSTRITMGLNLHLLVLNLNADYNLGKYDTVSLGLSLGI